MKIYKLAFKITNIIYKTSIGKKFRELIKSLCYFLVLRLSLGVVRVKGNKIFLKKHTPGFLRLLFFGVYEPFETNIFKKQIKKGNIVLDIGANIGYYTLIAAKLVGKDGKVFAFEPDPNNFLLLKKNVKLNNYQNVTLVNKAISDKSKNIKLYLSKNNFGDHRIYKSSENRESINIKCIRLDDYFKKINQRVDIIKMDIQGAEWAAIKGMQSLLRKNPNIKIIMEFSSDDLRKFGVNPKEFLDFLANLGFIFYNINEKKDKLEFINIDKIMEQFSGKEFTNLLCLKKNENITYR